MSIKRESLHLSFYLSKVLDHLQHQIINVNLLIRSVIDINIYTNILLLQISHFNKENN